MKTWISADKFVTKEVLVEGLFSKKPSERSICRICLENVNYIKLNEATTNDGAEESPVSEYLLESGEKTITIGNAATYVDNCIERAIQMMFHEEKSLVTVRNGETKIVDFIVTLISYEPSKPIWEWSAEQKYSTSMMYKEMGIKLYKCRRIHDAFFKFSKACKILITLEPMDDLQSDDKILSAKVNDLRNILYNNLAECHLICKNFESAIVLCDKVLKHDENNVKALYRRAVAHGNLRDFEKALSDMERVTILDVHNIAAKKKLFTYKAEVDKATRIFNNMVKKMFVTK